jgi:hypothetical protein
MTQCSGAIPPGTGVECCCLLSACAHRRAGDRGSRAHHRCRRDAAHRKPRHAGAYRRAFRRRSADAIPHRVAYRVGGEETLAQPCRIEADSNGSDRARSVDAPFARSNVLVVVAASVAVFRTLLFLQPVALGVVGPQPVAVLPHRGALRGRGSAAGRGHARGASPGRGGRPRSAPPPGHVRTCPVRTSGAAEHVVRSSKATNATLAVNSDSCEFGPLRVRSGPFARWEVARWEGFEPPAA